MFIIISGLAVLVAQRVTLPLLLTQDSHNCLRAIQDVGSQMNPNMLYSQLAYFQVKLIVAPNIHEN